MARLNAAWLNFVKRGQAWDHFWQDDVVAAGPSNQSLTATTNTFTVTAAAAVLAASITLTAGSNTVTVEAPTATLAAATTLTAGANTVTVTAPTAGILAQTTLTAGDQTIVLTAPTAMLVTGGAVTTVRVYYRGTPRDSRAVMMSRRYYYVDEEV